LYDNKSNLTTTALPPEDYLSWKSFRSFTKTTSLAWGIALAIDVVFISTIQNQFIQLKTIWQSAFFCMLYPCMYKALL
jgi:hypothetical protein